MADCFDLADKMIKRQARQAMSTEHGKRLVTLTEPDCNDSTVTIRHLPDRCIVMRLDGTLDLSKVFSGSLGECKRSDYLIVAEHGGKLVVVHIEIKRSTANRTAVCQQLCGSQCFVHYMQALGRSFGNHRTFLEEAEHRFVHYGHTGPRKRKTKITRSSDVHDTPEKALKIDNPNYVQFAMIAGGK